MSMFSSLPDLRQLAHHQNGRPLLDTTPRYEPFNTTAQIQKEKEKNFRFGWFGFKPDFLQVFNTSRWLLFFVGLTGALECTSTYGFIPGIISTLERRFEMSSSKSGFIVSSYQIFALVTMPFVTHIAGKTHKGKWLGAVTLLYGVGCFLFASPHFLTGRYEAPGSYATNVTSSQQTNTMCHQSSNNGSSTEQCTTETTESFSALSNYLYVFVVAQFFLSQCGGSLFTVGIAYMDENVKKKVSGLYVAIMFTIVCIGPTIGYVLIGQLLSLYVEWPIEDGYSAGLTPWDPRWIGNWWFGFPVLGTLGILVAIPLFGFPRKLPGSEELHDDEAQLPTKAAESDVTKADEEAQIQSIIERIRGALEDLLKSLLDLARSYSYVLLTLGVSFDNMSSSGMFAFAPKVCQILFGIPVTSSALYFGLSMIPGFAIGSLVGGWISKKIGVDCKKLLRFILIMYTISGMGICVYLMYCKDPPKAYGQLNNNMTCADSCACADNLYNPVCGENGMEYQSPCHAGCTALNHTTMVYSNCSCITSSRMQQNSTAYVTSGVTSLATHGACARDCEAYRVPLFFSTLFLMGMLGAFAAPSYMAAILRLVPPKQRSFGLGMQRCMVRIIGTIPGPMIYGYAMDNACAQWQTSCGQRGACLVYDSRKVGLFVFGLALGLRIVGATFISLAYLVYKPNAAIEEEKYDNADDVKLTNGDVK
ncbi:solute carrier organic anion transporter family member 4A1-like [Branchiostoma floridae]|uniref:Solute carrier organic anion transporter family member n=1 Tax=Branchiostoma floridae TaxID=7739 RepID=A0A9J7HHR9_BRAFL|nr:solute carrier organic anion transporter family member 4A1-like [Branchiostoma floridae]